MSADFIALQSTIGGMASEGGKVYTLLGGLDTPSGVLLVAKAFEVRPGAMEKRFQGSAAVSNDPRSENRDMLFTEKDIRDAIRDYFEFQGRGLLRIEADVARFDPASQIEPDGIDEHGRKYRISSGMTNGQMSVLALCWFARRQREVSNQMEDIVAFDDEFGITSIGMGELRIGPSGWPIE